MVGADKAEAAPGLLAMADEVGLPTVRAAALDWLVHNYAAAAGMPAYQALTKQQTDLVTAKACERLMRCQTLLQVSNCRGKSFPVAIRQACCCSQADSALLLHAGSSM